MKTTLSYFLTIFSFLLLSSGLNAKDLPVSTKVKQVTVFLRGAEVLRQSTVDLTPGMHILAFRSLASDIRPESVRVRGKGSFTILSVKPRNNYLVDGETSPEWKALNDKLTGLKNRRDELSVKTDVLKSEVTLLEKNQTVTGQNGLSVTALSNALTFYQKKMTEIKMQQLKVEKQIRDTDEEIKKLLQQMDQSKKRQEMASGEILVSVNVNKAGPASFEISYYTSRAAWHPGYDVRVDDLTREVNICFKAYIRQTTGESWDKIPVTLSTGNPALGGNKPELSPWYLDFANVKYYRTRTAKGAVLREKAMAAPAMSDFVNETTRMTTTQYQLQLPFPLYSEEKEQALTIKEISLPAEYAWYTVPKKSRDVFLVASVTGWKKYDLLSGKMNLFLEGGFVGTSYLDASQAKDTLKLTLGRDNRIKVEREKIEDFTRKKTLGNNVVETHGWKITVLNAKKIPVHVIVEDQIPVSRQKEITVEPLELSGGRLDRVTGKCVWDMRLSPGDSRSVTLKFSVKYPKDQGLFID